MGLGERLRELRRKSGLTRKQLEERSGVPQNTISRIELGRVQEMSTKTLMRLARGLQVSTDALLGMEESTRGEEAPSHPAARQRQAKPQAQE